MHGVYGNVGLTDDVGLTYMAVCVQSKTHVQTLLQRVILVHQTDASPIQRVRQRSAFPPNFIHSIDSSHMMMTAIACHKAGEELALTAFSFPYSSVC